MSETVAQSDSKSGSIYIVATGGTIAGVSLSPISAKYESGQLSIKALEKDIPNLSAFAENIHAIDLFTIDSSDITIAHWLILASRVQALLDLEDVNGVVITHGTDTLEETAYFLDLVLQSHKPVVLVGSMRAANSLSPDGPLNLYNAMAVIQHPDALEQGVMVVLNDTIFGARDVTKVNTTRVNTFKALNSGPIGHVVYGDVSFLRRKRIREAESAFPVVGLSNLPVVEILYEYAAASGAVFESLLASNPAGIVIAGTGAGNITINNQRWVRLARKQGIHVALSSRTGSGKVIKDRAGMADENIGLLAANNLNPQKARVLLMLGLTQTQDVSTLQDYFDRY